VERQITHSVIIEDNFSFTGPVCFLSLGSGSMPNAKILSCLLGRAIPNGALPIGEHHVRDAHEHDGQARTASSVKEYIAHDFSPCSFGLPDDCGIMALARISGLNPASGEAVLIFS
jgi:hypothetical protein